MTNIWSNNKYIEILINIMLFLLGINFMHLGQLFLPLIWLIYTELEYVYYLQVLFLLASQSIAIYGLGTILYFSLKKLVARYPRLFE